jgi:hypothetical protein
MPDKAPIRVQLMEQGIKLTSGDRDVSYGDPLKNLGLAGILKNICRDHQVRSMSPAEMEAMDQVLTKVARVFTGPQVKADNYIDGATYFAIGGEAALTDEESRAQQAMKAANTVMTPALRPAGETTVLG